MSSTTQPSVAARDARASIFGRVLVGIDGTPESLEAARQAGALATGPVTLLSAYDVTKTVVGASMAPAPPVHLDEAPFREAARSALERARPLVAPIEPVVKIARARAWEALLDEIGAGHETLVAVGAHRRSRATGILIGSTATELLHKAPCSVLIARRPLKKFPTAIAVGVDGSPEAAAAEAVARDMAERFDSDLSRYESVDDSVRTLVHATRESELLVVGSRGLKGIKALGSVSERVAHEAACSVLIVR